MGNARSASDSRMREQPHAFFATRGKDADKRARHTAPPADLPGELCGAAPPSLRVRGGPRWFRPPARHTCAACRRRPQDLTQPRARSLPPPPVRPAGIDPVYRDSSDT